MVVRYVWAPKLINEPDYLNKVPSIRCLALCHKVNVTARNEVLTTVLIKIQVFVNVKPFRLVNRHRSFEEA